MEGQRLLFFKLVILFVGRSSGQHCDRATTAQVQAGNLGQSGDFNWLGILHVQLHEEGKIHAALTGIVLVKINYALANADDVVRIPQHIFNSDSKVMFLAARDTPWFTKPKSYVTHPEYEYSTLNTIAIVELDLDDVDESPLNPICIPTGEIFNTSRYLYLTGFTDENQQMEKVFYTIQYLEKKVCEEFYNRAGLSSQKRIPSAYLCGYASSNVTQCVWDNGMALVSNVTGYFHLIGLGVHGPGCAAPARFIDLFPYLSWIKSVTSPDEFYDDDYRRKQDKEFIPVHELFTKNGSRPEDAIVYEHEYEWYPFETDKLKHYLVRPIGHDKAILIIPFNDTWEQYKHACKLPKTLMYKEHFELKAKYGGVKGVVYYKLSLYDMVNTVCSCVRIRVISKRVSEAVLSFKEEIDFKDGQQTNIHNKYKTPEGLYKSQSGIKRLPKKDIKWQPKPALLAPNIINDDDITSLRVLNYDLFIKIQFSDQAIVRFELYSERPGRLDPNREWPTTEAIATTPSEEDTTKADETKTTKTTNEEETTTTTPGGRANSRVQNMAKSHSGMGNWSDNMLENAEVSLMADLEEMQETESAARCERAPGAVMMVCWLVGACLRRAFFIMNN